MVLLSRYKKVTLLALFGCSVWCVTTGADQSGMKERTKTVRRQRGTEVKQAIAQELGKILTLSSSLIASLSECINCVFGVGKSLISSNDTFFSQKKVQQLEQYKQKLVAIRERLEHSLATTQKEVTALQKNFDL